MSQGRPATIHPTVFVAPGAIVLGDVTLGARSSVWFNTVIRGDSAEVVVGEDTNLQDNSVVHEDAGQPARIGARVTVGHRAIVHGCVIEDECLVGMGSVILSGARLGRGSLVGAASLVREGQIVPPDSLVVGSPARVVGPTSQAHRAAIRNGWSHYAELARFYMMRGLARGADPERQVTRDAGPMTALEWSDLVARFLAGPASPEGRAPDALLARIALLDRAVRLPAIDELRSDSALPILAETPDTDEPANAQGSDAAFETWRRQRLAISTRLASMGPGDWGRPIGHPTRGARTLGDWLREWVDEERQSALEAAE
jgi:carbonic anhydrase/acetyltransferase-like protein (isoleucine patch superfamily)